ncbi:hypothetical protein XA68_17867 [Ophiocordyceps unilateralis]|uniref:Uncharacterized protein n=1 Tax=Ophiocordyceps unilateralis TaxID=268505 RepID=A0A2A9P399_OPHUN|nr:hypothetical protein XA68_17867 [Ophiocordyceps unilateralis]
MLLETARRRSWASRWIRARVSTALSSRVFTIAIFICHTWHCRIVAFTHGAVQRLAIREASHTRSSPCACSSAFAMSCKSVSAGKLAIAFWTNVGFLASVKFAVPF